MPVKHVALHAGTPEITVTGTAGPVCSLSLLRTPGEEDKPPRHLLSRTLGAQLTRSVTLYGARPLNGDTPNATIVSGTDGQTVKLQTADGDTTLSLTTASGQPLWIRNAQGTVNIYGHEDSSAAGRIQTISEQPAGGKIRIREMFAWLPADISYKNKNIAGGLGRHYDNAGYNDILCLSLTGKRLITKQYLLASETELPDWNTGEQPDMEEPLALYSTYDATRALLTQINAAGNALITAYNVDGYISETRMCQKALGADNDVVTLFDVLRSADGLILSQTSGNGVTEDFQYNQRTRHVIRHVIRRADAILSDLHYEYDPAGNIVTLNEAETASQWHRNLYTDGERTFTYDTLYRLVQASGRERLPDSGRGPQTVLNANSACSNAVWYPYQENYIYDDGDNLTRIIHTGNRPWTREIEVSASSNRAHSQEQGGNPDAGFLAGGLQTHLADGRSLEWYADGQLKQVNSVTRECEPSDTETYCYSNKGTRTRKISRTKMSGGTQIFKTTYAGGIETRQRRLKAAITLDIVITETDRVRLTENRETGEVYLHWIFADYLGSSGIQTDWEGRITSREEYYPYGGSAGADEELIEVCDRTRRYSGKERDATGLIYYGWRYYQPETCRWLSADPGGLNDGINLYRFCWNNPVNVIDTDGRGCEGINAKSHTNGTQSDSNDLTSQKAKQNWSRLKGIVFPDNPSVFPRVHKSYLFERFTDEERQTPFSRNWKGVQQWTQEQRADNAFDIQNGLIKLEGENFSSYISASSNGIVSHIDNWKSNAIGYVLGRIEGVKKIIGFVPELDVVHHSSVFAGQGVLDAGMITIANGRIAYIENKSGHYQPDISRKLHTLKFLKEKNVDLSETFISERTTPQNHYESDIYYADEFLEKYPKGLLLESYDEKDHDWLPRSFSLAPLEREVMRATDEQHRQRLIFSGRLWTSNGQSLKLARHV